eukprot:10347506-Karenia_brevis.AAC.1
MFSEISEDENDDMEVTSNDDNINLASEVAKALLEADMPISEDFDPQVQQNKKGGPLPARDGRENFLIQTP